MLLVRTLLWHIVWSLDSISKDNLFVYDILVSNGNPIVCNDQSSDKIRWFASTLVADRLSWSWTLTILLIFNISKLKELMDHFTISVSLNIHLSTINVLIWFFLNAYLNTTLLTTWCWDNLFFLNFSFIFILWYVHRKGWLQWILNFSCLLLS